MFIFCYHSFLDNKFLFGAGGGVIQRTRERTYVTMDFAL